MKRETVLALSVALGWGCAVAVGAYAVVRGIQFFLYPDPNPATLVWSAHAGFFWRCWTCAYAGGLATFVAYLFARARPAGALRTLPGAIAVVTVLLALQTALLP
jgi:hypothetical protein